MSRKKPSHPEAAPDGPDFGILLALAFRVYVDELHRELAARGFDDMLPSFGVVFRALDEQPLTLTQLASQLQVSKQAVAKIVAQMRSRDLVAQQDDDDDRRAKNLVLTRRGQAAVDAAKAIGARAEARLCKEVGADAVAGMRTALEHLVVTGGGETEMRARRVRPLW
jgi:DNA-binding MarR family transcriptional regulator